MQSKRHSRRQKSCAAFVGQDTVATGLWNAVRPMTELSAEDLYASSDANVRTAVISVFNLQLQAAPSVATTFFNSPAPLVAPVDGAFVDQLATALVAAAISGSSLYGFGGTINSDAAQTLYTSLLTPAPVVDGSTVGIAAESQNLYTTLFGANCLTPDHTFAEYVADSASGWAAQLASYVTTDQFVNGEMAKIIGSANWQDPLNLIFYKIFALDPAGDHINNVLPIWRSACPQLDIAPTWQIQNYIPAFDYNSETYVGAATSAISVRTWTGSGGFPVVQDYTYGQEVGGFVLGPATTYGLATGASPSNTTSESSSTVFGCFVPGTTVHLPGGETMPIEEVSQGHEVLGHAGRVGTRSSETVLVPLPDGATIYGFNGEEPFVSSGHILMTTDGWKALEPEIALEENPDRPTGQLRVGDRLLRLLSSDPNDYAEVEIKDITSKQLPPGSHLHGLHLLESLSYHANGYVAGVNYPVITEQRLSDGFATLSSGERKLIRQHFEAIDPLLTKALGRWVTLPLNRALSDQPNQG